MRLKTQNEYVKKIVLKYLLFNFRMKTEVSYNPWSKGSLEEFLFYCCPECDVRDQSKETFLEHALIDHPHSQPFLQPLQIKEEVSSEASKNLFPVKVEIDDSVDIKNDALGDNKIELQEFNDDNDYYMDYENDQAEEFQNFESDSEFNGEEEKVGKKCHVGPFLCKICNGR